MQPEVRPEGGTMFRQILVTLDGSSYGERVLPYIGDLAAPMQAKVTLLAVIQVDLVPAMEDERPPDPRRIEGARKYLEERADELRESGVQVETDVRSGSPSRMIVEAARELGADLIAMSTQGLGAETEQGLGGTASKVLMTSPCPVFMVRIQRPAPPRGPAEERWQGEGGANVG